MSTEPVEHRVTRAYAAHHSALLAVAYRMLGTFADAEDVVQDAFLRFRAALENGVDPESDRAYLVTITSRRAIDELRSARVRRESYVGPWLPEPAVEGMTDLADDAALSDSVSTAFLVLLERLGPDQRAVFLLHDVFGVPTDEVARIVGKSSTAVRQIATRARRHLHDATPRFDTERRAAQRLADRFFAAAREGDLEGLVRALAPDAQFVGDGGDSRRGVTRVVHGAEPVAKLVRSIFGQLATLGGRLEPVQIGPQPAVLLLDADGRLAGVWTLVVDQDRVAAVHGMVNPDKLSHLGLPLTTLQWGRPSGSTTRNAPDAR